MLLVFLLIRLLIKIYQYNFVFFFEPSRLAGIYQFTAGIARFRAQIDYPIRRTDNIHIVFDNDDRMSLFYQCIKGSE